MKNIKWLATLAVLVLLITGCTPQQHKELPDRVVPDGERTATIVGEPTKVGIGVVAEKVANKEGVVFVIASSSCDSCQEYWQTLQNYDRPIYFVEHDKEKDNETLMKFVNEVLHGDVKYTPTTYLSVDGEIALATDSETASMHGVTIGDVGVLGYDQLEFMFGVLEDEIAGG